MEAVGTAWDEAYTISSVEEQLWNFVSSMTLRLASISIPMRGIRGNIRCYASDQ